MKSRDIGIEVVVVLGVVLLTWFFLFKLITKPEEFVISLTATPPATQVATPVPKVATPAAPTDVVVVTPSPAVKVTPVAKPAKKSACSKAERDAYAKAYSNADKANKLLGYKKFVIAVEPWC